MDIAIDSVLGSDVGVIPSYPVAFLSMAADELTRHIQMGNWSRVFYN